MSDDLYRSILGLLGTVALGVGLWKVKLPSKPRYVDPALGKVLPNTIPYGMSILPPMVKAAAYSDRAVRRLELYLGGGEPLGGDEPVADHAPNVPQPVQFRPGEPQTFAEYAGQDHFVPFLAAEVRTMPNAKLTRPQLFLGHPGLGKTLLAKVLANEIHRELVRRGFQQPDFILALGSDMKEREALDKVIRRAAERPGNVLFIDEFHTIVTTENIDKWLLLLDEHRWQFLGDQNPTNLPDFTILAATTDYGALHNALRRRFAERQLRPLSEGEIAHAVTQRFAIDPVAAWLAASRTHHGGAPWEAIALLTEAEVLARDRQADVIGPQDVQEVFRIWDLDEWGLRPHDRSVLKALLTQRREQRGRTKADPPQVIYAASEDATVAMARVDREAYRQDIKPRLMARGFLITSSKGQQLTDLAVHTYGVRT